MEAGFRAFRYATADPARGQPFNSHHAVRKTYQDCAEIREGVGPDGDWAVDYHTRLDFPDAVRLSTLIEPLEPYFAEDLVRSENPGVYRELRAHVKVPIAVGEQFGSKWDIRWLVENQLIDYARVTLPNVGGITEYMKIAALCDTHYVGLIPHFTGPVSESASGALLWRFPRAGDDGDAGQWRPQLCPPAAILRFQEWEIVAQPPPRTRSGTGYKTPATGGRDHGTLTAHSHAPSSRRVHHQLVGQAGPDVTALLGRRPWP